MNQTIGISMLTNGARKEYLQRCIESFLENCHYRPLNIAIFDNGSTDDTWPYLCTLPKIYGVKWFTARSEEDIGCAAGTNRSIMMLRDASNFHIHLESDFIHMPESETGIDKQWLNRAMSFIQDNDDCDYMYLRRMENENDMMMHWWAQWMPSISNKRGEFQKCDGFWWSNNPTLFTMDSLMRSGTLPLSEEIDGGKGTAGWSQPELQAPKPSNAWIHKWGVFAHERVEPHSIEYGCGNFNKIGKSSCKYGFFIDDRSEFCQQCMLKSGVEDMPLHQDRWLKALHSNESVSAYSIVHNNEVFQSTLEPCIKKIGIKHEVLPSTDCMARTYNECIERSESRFVLFCHPDVTFRIDTIKHIKEQLIQDHVGVVGLIGVDDYNQTVWCRDLKIPQKVSALDSCIFAIDKEKGLRFDEASFSGLHLCAEDLCYQARERGLKVLCLPAKGFNHLSTTVVNEGVMWGDYKRYRKVLNDKWSSKFKRVVTT